MEPLNKSLKNIIQFILCIQDSCDKHRKCMEHIWLQEYASYKAEWKQNLAECKIQKEKNSECNSPKESKCLMDQDESLELEELALADSLLKKARNIRAKNQKLINGLIESKNISALSNDKGALISKCSSSSQTFEKNKNLKKISHSKSDFIINSHKCTIVPRSKSATIPVVPKEELRLSCNSKSCNLLSSKCNALKHTKNKLKTSDDLTVVSRTDLDMLKKLNLNCHEADGKKATSSDASESQHPISSYPSHKEFLDIMKVRLTAVSSHIKLKIWYPFVSSKSEALLTAVNCNAFSSINKVYSVLYRIQETMMWIDLLYLIETEICPTFVVDFNDVNTLRICSYLQSIFHPTSQRIPILHPNR